MSPDAQRVPTGGSWKTFAAVAVCALPGGLLGVHLAGLLFFLNPDIPFSPTALVGPALWHALLLGSVSALALQLFVRFRLGRAVALLPWLCATTYALVALLDFANVAEYSFFLPAGMNRRLIKAALWLTVAATVTFYLGVAQRARGRLSGAKTNVTLAAIALLTIYVLVERRDAFEPPPVHVPRSSMVETSDRPHLLVVGIESATLDAILPLAEQGVLPFLAECLQIGSHARLETLETDAHPSQWTSWATGKHPFRHGVTSNQSFRSYGFGGRVLDLLPVGVAYSTWAARPIALTQLDSRALFGWEVIERLGVPTLVVGWPYTSQRPPRGDVSNPALTPDLSSLDPELLPLANADLARALEVASWWQSTPAETSQPQASFLFLDGLRDVSLSSFGGYAARQFDGDLGAANKEAADRLTTYYGFLDQLILELWQQIPEPRVLAISSAFGADAPTPLQRLFGALGRNTARSGRLNSGPDGILLFLGDDFQRGRFLPRAHINDVVPTLLFSLGFPLARDFDGRVLREAFSDVALGQRPTLVLPSYETLRTGSLDADARNRRPDPQVLSDGG